MRCGANASRLPRNFGAPDGASPSHAVTNSCAGRIPLLTGERGGVELRPVTPPGSRIGRKMGETTGERYKICAHNVTKCA